MGGHELAGVAEDPFGSDRARTAARKMTVGPMVVTWWPASDQLMVPTRHSSRTPGTAVVASGRPCGRTRAKIITVTRTATLSVSANHDVAAECYRRVATVGDEKCW